MTKKPSGSTIVVGIDGSQGADAAVGWVAEHGAALATHVVAVHVVSRVDLWDLAALQVDTAPVLEERREQLGGDWTEPLRAAGLKVTARLVRGDPATELLRIAEQQDAALLVVGTKRHTALHDIVLGGTAHKIANHARRPVALIPAPSPPPRRRPSTPDTRQVRPLF